MRTPVLLLRFAAKAMLNVVGAGVAGEFAIEVLPEAVQELWQWWGKSREELRRRAEIEALAQAPAAEVRKAVNAIVREVAADRPPPVRQALASCLSQLPMAIRESLRRADDPTGTTLAPDTRLQSAEDLLDLLTVGGQWNSSDASRSGPPKEPRSEAASAEESFPGRITLDVTAGPHKGRSFTFAGHDTFLVGRSQRAHFRLPGKDKYFSRLHFMVELNPPFCRLLDMGSRNGTYVNGQRIATADLHDGDCINAGHTLMRISITGRTAPPTPSVAAPQQTVTYAPAPPPAAEPARSRAARSGLSPVSRPCPGCGEPMTATAPICLACEEQAQGRPQPIAGYRLVRELGRGGMGVVYLALRNEDNNVVALKTIIPAVAGSSKQVERFLREARILQQLDHPNIVAFRDMGESSGTLFFAMDLVPGTDAGKILKSEGPLPLARAVALVCQMLDGLAFAHGRRFVHRDVKPANLLVAQQDGREVARLADFGLARVYHASQLSGLSVTGEIGGTIAFMAPEQITNYREAKPPVDQYAAAATLYNLLTGTYIFDLPREPQRRLLMILQDEPVPIRQRRPDLPEELAAVIHQALSREPSDRFADAAEMREALAPFAP